MSSEKKKNTKSNASLEDNDELFSQWVIKKWFKTNIEINFLKKVFLQLFTPIFEDLTEKFNEKKRNDIFLNFINIVFPTVLDVYKWHESEKAQHDIGLLKALEEIAVCDWYIDLLTSYSSQYSKKTSK